jgi:hypothetical protein
MRLPILIIEPRQEIAAALEDVINSANFTAIVRPYVDRLGDLGITPAAIVVRITFEGVSEPSHAVLARMAPHRPPVVAIAWTDEAVEEARRLNCEVVLRAADVRGLCDALTRVVHT